MFYIFVFSPQSVCCELFNCACSLWTEIFMQIVMNWNLKFHTNYSLLGEAFPEETKIWQRKFHAVKTRSSWGAPAKRGIWLHAQKEYQQVEAELNPWPLAETGNPCKRVQSNQDGDPCNPTLTNYKNHPSINSYE